MEVHIRQTVTLVFEQARFQSQIIRSIVLSVNVIRQFSGHDIQRTDHLEEERIIYIIRGIRNDGKDQVNELFILSCGGIGFQGIAEL